MALAPINTTTASTAASVQSSYISIKNIKNSIIGSPTAKAGLVQDGIVPFLVEWLQVDRPAGEDPPIHERTVIEAAHVISSLSYGSPESLHYLLLAQTPQALLNAIVYLQPTDTSVLRAALVRALKSIAVALADAVGPALWGLDPQFYPAETSTESMNTLEELFQMESLDIYLPLLADSSNQTSMYIALLLGNALRRASHRQAVADWLPPSERAKEIKGKRGWEKPDMMRNNSSSAGRDGGWVVRYLVEMLYSKDIKVQEASLLALAAVVKDNTAVATSLTRSSTEADASTSQSLPTSPFSSVSSLSKSRNITIKLAACRCLMQIIRSHSSGPAMEGPLKDTANSLLGILNNVLASPHESHISRAQACYILAQLVADDQTLQEAALHCESTVRLAQVVREVTPIYDDGWPEDEPESRWRLREASLTALACCALEIEDIRRSVLKLSPPLLPLISISLTHPKNGVRYGAAQCARTMSRSVSLLRTCFGESDISMRLLDIVKGDGETDTRVRNVALMAIANLIHDFAPSRVALIESGALTPICNLTRHTDDTIVVNALCVLRNALYRSGVDDKRAISKDLGWEHFTRLLESPSVLIREQAAGCLRNFVGGSGDAEPVVQGIGAEKLSQILERLLDSAHVETTVHALQALLGIITAHSPGTRAQAITWTPLFACVRNCLDSPSPQVRRIAINCVSQLVLHRRHKELREAGIESVLKGMVGGGDGTLGAGGKEDDKDAREGIRKALGLFENAGRMSTR